MKKIKLLAVVPYEGLAEAVSVVAGKYAESVETTIRVGDLQQGLECALHAQQEGFDVVMSRGGTAELLLKHLELPVVNIEVSGYDYMRAIKMATAITGLKAIVGYSSITGHAQSVATLLNADVCIETIQSAEDIQEKLKELLLRGCSLVIGDVATYRIAREMGMNAMLITSGEESISGAFETSIWLMRAFSGLKERFARLESLCKCGQTLMVLIDGNGALRFESRALSSVGLSVDALQKLLHPAPQERRENIVLQKADHIYNVALTPKWDEAGAVYYCFDILPQRMERAEGLQGVEIENYRVYLHGTTEPFDAVGVFDADTVRNAIAFGQTNRPVYITGRSEAEKRSIARCVHRYSERWALPFVQIDCELTDPVEALRALAVGDPGSALYCGATLCFAELDCLTQAQWQALRRELSVLDTERYRLLATASAGSVFSQKDDAWLLQTFPLRLHIAESSHCVQDLERFVNLNIIAFNSEYGKQVVGMEPEAMAHLLQYPWGSDMERLRSAVGQLVLLAQSPYLTVADVRHAMTNCYPRGEENEISLQGTLAEIELQIIRRVLKEEKENYSKTAARLGIGRSTLWRKLADDNETKKEP